ncbi:MAG: response regulator [Emticicia sp.]|nr:response regulator [Emticicia sp.]
MIKIAIVDDHEIFLKGLEGILQQTETFKVCHTYLNGSELLKVLPLSDLDVLLLDLQLPDISPEDLLSAIRQKQPDLKIIYLTLVRGNRYFNKLSEIGFEGYLLKDSPIEILKEAINSVYLGNQFLW